MEAIVSALGSQSAAGPQRGAAALALAEVARLAEGAGAHELAARALDEALRLAPGYADLHYQRACLLIVLQRRSEARR